MVGLIDGYIVLRKPSVSLVCVKMGLLGSPDYRWPLLISPYSPDSYV